MDDTIDDLARRVLERFTSVPPDQRLLIAIAGVPGSGKSTLAFPLVDAINAKLSSRSSTTKPPTSKVGHKAPERSHIDQDTALLDAQQPTNDTEDSAPADGGFSHERFALAIGLDGWHFSRDELDNFPNPLEARTRRGAAFTFDAASYLSFIQSLRQPITTAHTIPYFIFSHSHKDPLPSPHPITPRNRLIVLEGLYTLVNEGIWAEATTMMDLQIWLECDPQIVRERLLKRCLKEGIEDTAEKAQKRVDESDMLNGDWIKARLTRDPDLIVVESKEDARLVASGA